MTPKKDDWPCWKITKCDKKNGCGIQEHAGMACWEVAAHLDDFRNAFNICQDCIVYLSKGKNAVLSENDILDIMARKGLCAFASNCPANTATREH